MEQTNLTGNSKVGKMVGRERYNVIRNQKRQKKHDEFKFMFPWALNDDSSFTEQQIEELEQEWILLHKRLDDIKTKR